MIQKNLITPSNTSVQMLFALLRASLHEQEIEQSFFHGISNEDWQLCYRLATEHGVMALAWDGVVKLPKELKPPVVLKLKWAASVESYERKYQHYCRTINEVSHIYAEHGIATMQLKGVGFSTLYPNPSHREGGDIDIYTYSFDNSKMSDKEANFLADTLMQQRGINVDKHYPKHSNFYYNGIPFENHRTFLNVESYHIAKQVDGILRESKNPELVSLVVGEVLIPSPVFNTLFIAFHAFQHYGSGLALHHLCDWVMILRRYGLYIPEQIIDKKYLAGIFALTKLCNQYLGTSHYVVGGDEIIDEIADEMMTEILSPRYSSTVPTCNKIGIIVYKIRRLLHEYQLKNRVIEYSLAKRIWTSFVCHLINPKTVFLR